MLLLRSSVTFCSVDPKMINALFKKFRSNDIVHVAWLVRLCYFNFGIFSPKFTRFLVLHFQQEKSVVLVNTRIASFCFFDGCWAFICSRIAHLHASFVFVHQDSEVFNAAGAPPALVIVDIVSIVHDTTLLQATAICWKIIAISKHHIEGVS